MIPNHLLRSLLVLACLATAGAVGAAVPAEAQEVTLAWRFEPGDVWVYRQTMTSRTTTPRGEATQTQIMRMRQEVLEVEPDGTADVRTTFLSMRTEMDGPQGRQVYDSEDPDEAAAPGTQVPMGLVGVSLDMTVAPDGRVQSVHGVDEFMDRILGSLGEMSPEEASQARAMMDDMFGEDEMLSQLQQAMAIVPDGPVGPGDTWSGTFEMQLPFATMRSEYTYELEAVVDREGRRVALIDVTGTMSAVDMDANSPMAGMMSLGPSDMTGTLEFDVDRGIILDTHLDTVMEMEVMGTTMQSESTYAMELVEDS